jgi:hypothetical protein
MITDLLLNFNIFLSMSQLTDIITTALGNGGVGIFDYQVKKPKPLL